MELELALHPDDVAKLPRSKNLGAPKLARPRQNVLRLVWHDGPDRGLRADGLALAEQRGVWRLEPLIPGDAVWLPAQPTPVLAQGKGPAALGRPIPDPLVPVAAFDGRLTTTVVPTPDGAVTVRLLRGDLRGVMTTSPVCRIALEGPDCAVRSLALALADDVRLTVPRAGLAAEAMAAAEGWPVPPRAQGAPHSAADEPVAVAFARVMGHLTDVLVYFAPLAIDAGDHTEPVHQMRVAVRRARSVIAVFSHALACPLVAEANLHLKVLGAVLGPARDWDVFVTETLSPVLAAFPGDDRLRRLESAAARLRAASHASLNAWLGGAAFRRLGISLAWLASGQAWHDTLEPERRDLLAVDLPDFASVVLRHRWKKLQSAGKGIEELDIPALHGLRLRGKRMRYAIEIFQPRHHAKPAQRLLRRLSVLQQRLGVLNDGAVAGSLLTQLEGPGGRHGYAVGLVMGFLAAGVADTRPGIIEAWDKISRIAPVWT